MLYKKKDNITPGIGDYDQSNFTIQSTLNKNIKKINQGKFMMILVGQRSRKIKSTERQRNIFIKRNRENYKRYIGPGYYEIPSGFNVVKTIGKGNPIISRVRCY